MQIPEILKTISKKLHTRHAKAIVVGGSVRDYFLKLSPKDFDIEVYGLSSLSELEKILSEFGSVNLVGKSFGVLKCVHEGEEYDFSFPRTESKISGGHKGFEVQVDGTLDFKTASMRRDFTINAMGYDIEERSFLDPFNAKEDMAHNILRHIDDTSFAEDPLRVYRAVQFCARFHLTLAEKTKLLCRKMTEEGMLEELPKERVYEEFKKLLLKADQPSIGFSLMRVLGVVRYFPELEALITVPQDPKYHPEGDVWVHTLMALDAMQDELKIKNAPERSDKCPWGKKLKIEEKQKLKLLFAVLCHDFGKPFTTTIELKNGESMEWNSSARLPLNAEHFARIRAISHEKAGVEPTRRFMYRLTEEHDFIESILPLVAHHLKPSQFYEQGAKAAAIRRLATKVNIEELVAVAKADFLGRTTAEAQTGIYEAGEWLLEKAKDLEVQKRPLENLLQGRDLIALGMKPSPVFSTVLNDVYEKQMDGVLRTKEEAIAYVHRKFLL